MHHLFPLAKGDPLCPLGFHPQVRWPTRCKRCFRDYKEHGGRKKDDDFTVSSPSLSTWSSPSSRNRDEDNGEAGDKPGRSWSSTQNLSPDPKKNKPDDLTPGFTRTSASWTSTPDLGGINDSTAVTVSLRLPRKKPTPPDTGQITETPSVTLRRPSKSPSPSPPTPAPPAAAPPTQPPLLTIHKNDSLAERVRKMQLFKAHSNSFEKESSQEREKEKEKERDRNSMRRSTSRSREEEATEKAKVAKENDVNFLMQIKSSRTTGASGKAKPPLRGGPAGKEGAGDTSDSSQDDTDDNISNAGTTTTEATLVDRNTNEYQEQIESLQSEVELYKKRCERVEKEKSDILLRRLANLDTGSKAGLTGRSSEVLKLQQKVNSLTAQNEDLKDEKKSLTLKVKELEADIEARPSQELATRQVEQLRSKLLAAETLCEELMDENEDMKKELRELEEEIEEMHDNFREDQVDEYSSLRRELEQTIKNCRVLSFKLKKTERRAEQLENEKQEQEKKLLEIVGGQSGLDRVSKIKDLEQELARSNEVALRLQRELQEVQGRLATLPNSHNGHAPKLGAIGRSGSGDGKVSRASLTRGGSQEDPTQLLRDLQDSLEREADLREQLRNAEDEAVNLRKKASRAEDDNESLNLQLKKMATKARTRKLSPTPPVNRLSIEPPIEKDEGISDEEDPAELRILLELNEQEAVVLRRKVEDLELESDSLKKQVKDLTEKVTATSTKPTTTGLKRNTLFKGNGLTDEKIKVLEDEIAELRKKLIEKERDCERLHAELSTAQRRPKGSLLKAKSLDGCSPQETVDRKRQLEVIEQEASVLRTRTQCLEADNEKLQAENKKLQLLRGTKLLKTDKTIEQSTEKIQQLEGELKEALAKVKELEAAGHEEDKPEKKVTFGGVLTKKDADKIKLKQDEIDKMKITLTKVEKERDKLADILKELKEQSIKTFRLRTPKKPTDLTTKLQLKRMVDDLESEIGEMCVIMKNAEIEKSPSKPNQTKELEKTIDEMRRKLSETESELTNEKNRLQTEIATMKEQNSKLQGKCTEVQSQKETLQLEVTSMREDKKKLEVQVNKLNIDLKSTSTKQSSLSECMKKVDEYKSELEEKEKEMSNLRKQVEAIRGLEQDKYKLIKEIGDKTKRIVEFEKKLKESEEKFKRSERQLTMRKDRVSKLEKELSEEKEQSEVMTTSQRRMSMDWISEKEDLILVLTSAESRLKILRDEHKALRADSELKIVTLESHVAAKEIHIKQLEDALRETSNQKYDEAISSVEMAQLSEKLDTITRELATKEHELASAKEENGRRQREQGQLQEQVLHYEQDKLRMEKDNNQLDNTVKLHKKEAGYWESRAGEFETDLQAERKKVDRMKINHDKDIRNKEAELSALKGKLRTLEQTSGAGTKKISELKQDFEEKMKKLEHQLAMERQEYEDLTGKYEILEEEHVVTKAKLTIEKETAQGELLQVQRELSCTIAKHKTLQDTYNNQTDAWIKEKMELQEKLSELEERLCGGGWEVEKARLQTKLDQREKEVRELNAQRDMVTHQLDTHKRELDEMRQKLEDYEKFQKVQRNMASENSSMEQEMKSLQNKLSALERTKKADLAELRQRYELQMQGMQGQLQSLQNQVSRFKREGDTYKQMLEAAHKSMAELKAGKGDVRMKRASISSLDELEESKMKLSMVEQQLACVEDELCDARLEASRVKTELVSERSTSEVRLAEMQSKLNEFEEDRLLATGRTKIPGMRTRMELAWQKERDDQQRLIQETSTLARDLRQTLFEVERERDKERLDMKRRIDQLKRTTEEETDENKKKVTELQCDLLELRDAHAKLRTTNEKLRREKERHEREREQAKLLVASLKRTQQEDDRKISYLLEQIEDLIKQSPELFKNSTSTKTESSTSNLLTPTPPRRNRSKSNSREATPESGISEGSVASTLARLQKATEDLKSSRLAERQRRQANMKRASSTEPRAVTMVSPRSNGRAPPPSLHKRSLSLEQTTKEHGVIWKTEEDSMSSIQSLDGDDNRLYTARDNSLDSRLSGGSTQSDVLPASDKKKKKGLFGKLKQLTKSRSIDDQTAGVDVPDFRPIGFVSQGSDSDTSAAGSKRDLRGKLSDMFHRKGAHSRSVSKERKRELSTPLPERTSASARPLSQNNGSTTQIVQMSPQPVRSDMSASSRAASMTPGMLRKHK